MHAVSYSDPSSGEETSRSPSPVPQRERYRVKTPERSQTQTNSFSRSPSKMEDRAPRERQVGSSPSPDRRRSGTCFECHRPGHFRRDCPNRSRVRSASPPLSNRKGTDTKHVSFKSSPTVGAATRVIPSIRSGAMGYGESAWRISVRVNGVDLSTVADTAAEITILSESVYGSMSPRPKVLSHVDVNLAGGGATMSVGSLGPVQLEIGGDRVEHCVYVAPLQDDMLLGIDFLQDYGVRLHCGTGELQLGDSEPVQLMHKSGVSSVKAVSVRRVRLPPFSVGIVECSASRELPEFILEPVDNFPSGVLPARSFNNSGKSGKLCLINMTQRSHVFKAGQELAAATIASEVESKPFTVRRVETGENAEAKQHIRGLLEDVRKHAPPDVRDEAVRLLTECSRRVTLI